MGTTKAQVYQQTLGFTRKYIHQYQNNLSTDLWLYLTGEQNKRNIQNTKFKSDTSDIRFLTGAKSTSSNLTQSVSGF